jgi:hypothetical protein
MRQVTVLLKGLPQTIRNNKVYSLSKIRKNAKSKSTEE